MFVYDVYTDVEVSLFRSIVFYGDVYGCTVQSRFDENIFYSKRIADYEFDRLPYTGRVVTIKSVRNIG